MTSPSPHDWRPYASRVTVDWLRDAPDLIHRRLTGTLVSADLSGFTAMSERLAALGREGAERLTGIVNGCFEALIAIADSEGGDVLKFGGDALLIWFPGADSALAAARASARMQQTIRAPRFARIGLKMSVGGHFGDFDLFLVGEPTWRELVLAGAPVTRAVELESAAEAGQVLVSPELAAGLPPAWLGERTDHGVLLAAPPLRRPRVVPQEERGPAPEELVSPGLRDDIRALSRLGGEHRIASIVFLEVEGTDASLEEHGAEVFARSLDSLVRAVQGLQRVFGVQFLYTDVIADGIKLIASAGAPRSTVDDDEAALRYAVQVVHGDPLGRLKGGVNGGRIFAGFLGAPGRRTYTVMGDPVNLSARLMAHARPGQVVASAAVVENGRVRVTADELPPFLVKGKTQPIKAYVVHDVDAERLPDTAPERLPLVGRDAELEVLRGWVSDAVAGRGRAVVLSGAAGIGKSRLVEEVAADERLFTRVTVECQPYLSTTPYAAAKVLLRRLFGIQHSASREEAGEALTRTVTRVRPSLLPLLPLLAVPVEAEVPPTEEAAAIADEFVVARTHDAVLELLTVMVATPTLIVAEDAYYADEASAALFRTLAQSVAEHPWLMVAAARPGTAVVLGELEQVERLELEPLDATAVAELAAHALGDASVVRHDLGAAERADGNPLFVLQLMEAVRAGVETADLPESVERVIAERLDRLVPEDRTLLRYAAVLGPRFDTRLLSLVLTGAGLPTPQPAAWERLGDLVEFSGESTASFRHLLYRDVAYEALPYRPRAKLHQQVGELLEASSYADDVGLLAEHFFRAGDHERTWRYSVAAGDRAWKQMAVAEAVAAYERALQVRRGIPEISPIEVARVMEALGDVNERAGNYEVADKRYRAATDLIRAARPARSLLLMHKRGVLRERMGRFRQAGRWYDRGRAAFEAGGSVGNDAPFRSAAAGILLRLGRQDEALAMAADAAAYAARCEDPESEAQACLVAQACCGELGKPDDVYGRRALELFVELGDALSQAKVLINEGNALYFGGRWSQAAHRYRGAAQRAGTAGDLVFGAMARTNLAEILSDQGHVTEAAAEFRAAHETFRRAAHGPGQAYTLGNLGRAQARAGDAAEGLESLREARARFESIGSSTFAVETDLRIAEALLLSGDTAAAAEQLVCISPAVENGGGFPGSDAFLARLRCWIERQEGRADVALEEARTAVDLAALAGVRFERAVALNEVAGILDDPAVEHEVAEELSALGVVRLPALPVPL
ncbi:MAG TPA: AAA family ATPase [Nocardioides sp.]|nr:AAA family ATPase [Nocardioides sp.]